jgi:GntR family negative regulator for fad regulon and positive regulator of fabA
MLDKNLMTRLSLHPTEFVEQRLITSILDGTFAPGTPLPNERKLSDALGVTRPTLRETLQRLGREGWLTIAHGKATRVNDFWKKGGMGLLSTLSRYLEYLPAGFILHLLEARSHLMPIMAQLARKNHPDCLLEYLAQGELLEPRAENFSSYDWQLQLLMAEKADNPIFLLMLNDFSSLYQTLARQYFCLPEARQASRVYYRQLYQAIRRNEATVVPIVQGAMQKSIQLWQALKQDKACRD